MCVSCLSPCISAPLREGRPLRTTAITLVALGVIALVVGTLASLSLQGTLRTTLAAVGANGVTGFIGGGSLAVVLGYCLYASRKTSGQTALPSQEQMTTLTEYLSGRAKTKGEVTVTLFAPSDEETASKSISCMSITSIPQHVFLKYEHFLDVRTPILSAARELFSACGFNHFIEPLDCHNEGNAWVEIYPSSETPGLTPEDREDLYLFYQKKDPEKYQAHFEHILRLICQQNLLITHLPDCFPLTKKGKFILLRLEKASDLRSSIQKFFDAMPTAWYPAFQMIVRDEAQGVKPEDIEYTASSAREKDREEYEAYRKAKKISGVTDPVVYKGTDAELKKAAQTLTETLKAKRQHCKTLYHGRLIRVSSTTSNLDLYLENGMIYSYEPFTQGSTDRFLVRC